MFFGNGLTSSLFNAMATHPPLEERIRAIDPNWDGKFPDPAVAEAEDQESNLGRQTKPRSAFPPIIPGFPAGAGGLATAATAIQAASVLPNLGNPTPLHLRYADELRESFPENVRAAARDPNGATALLYALLLSEEARHPRHATRGTRPPRRPGDSRTDRRALAGSFAARSTRAFAAGESRVAGVAAAARRRIPEVQRHPGLAHRERRADRPV